MAISERFSSLRQRLGASRQVEDERLLQLYWNRAELKKELTRLQAERDQLLEQIRADEPCDACDQPGARVVAELASQNFVRRRLYTTDHEMRRDGGGVLVTARRGKAESIPSTSRMRFPLNH